MVFVIHFRLIFVLHDMFALTQGTFLQTTTRVIQETLYKANRASVRLFQKAHEIGNKTLKQAFIYLLPFSSRTYFSWFPNVPTVTATLARVIRPTVRPPPSRPLKAIRALFYRIRIKTSILLIAFCRSTCDAHGAQQKLTWSYYSHPHW